jgi:TonB family protein
MKLVATWVSILASVVVLVASPSPKDICVVHWKSINYNPVARGARLQGDVRLEVSVGPDGKVSDVRVLPSDAHKLLRDEAVKNMNEWTFSAGEKRSFDIVYEFRLIMPETDYDAPTSVYVDFPTKVHVESQFKVIMRD